MLGVRAFHLFYCLERHDSCFYLFFLSSFCIVCIVFTHTPVCSLWATGFQKMDFLACYSVRDGCITLASHRSYCIFHISLSSGHGASAVLTLLFISHCHTIVVVAVYKFDDPLALRFIPN